MSRVIVFFWRSSPLAKPVAQCSTDEAPGSSGSYFHVCQDPSSIEPYSFCGWPVGGVHPGCPLWFPGSAKFTHALFWRQQCMVRIPSCPHIQQKSHGNLPQPLAIYPVCMHFEHLLLMLKMLTMPWFNFVPGCCSNWLVFPWVLSTSLVSLSCSATKSSASWRYCSKLRHSPRFA